MAYGLFKATCFSVVIIIFYTCSIDGEYVPKEGDEVTYKVCKIPPKMEKVQAVHVKITHLVEGTTHETWDQPSPKAH